jgi:phosphomannomutase / phosphoglucomutase
MYEEINPHIFRAYDIRGIAEKDLPDTTAIRIGKGIGVYLKQLSGSNVNVIVGRDNRLSSERLKQSLIQGLISVGCHVIDIDLCTSPIFYVAVIERQALGGVMVTGSHNPSEYNGFKIVGPEAAPISGIDVADSVQAKKFLESSGSYERDSIIEEYSARILQTLKLKRPIKVAVDTGNGVAGIVVPDVLRKLGCEVVEVFTELDGSFPNHLPNPEKEASLTELKKQVIESGADLGLGFDGDGDRIGLVDEKGIYREADYITIMLARDFLGRQPGSKVLIDVKTSQNTINDIKAHGGEPVLWKTGHSVVKRKMREDGILLGGELSGHMFVFEDYYPIDDALYASCRLIQYLSQDVKSVSDHFFSLPRLYSTRLIEMPCADEIKFNVIEALQQDFKKLYGDVNTIDGVRVNFEHGWAIVRASNTTPNLTLRFEADSTEHLEEIKSTVLAHIKIYTSGE